MNGNSVKASVGVLKPDVEGEAVVGGRARRAALGVYGARERGRQRGTTRRGSKYRGPAPSSPAQSDTRTSFKPSRSSFASRKRFSSLISERIQTVNPATVRPTTSNNLFSQSNSQSQKITFKKFNRFERPNLKKNFLNKYFSKKDRTPGILTDENILQNLENEEIRLERLLTTLEVSTLHPQEMSEEYLEVATIRSPYTFNIEDNQKSTRFITITKTNTRSSEINPSNSFTSTFPSGSVRPSPTIRPSAPVSSTPLFDIASIPAPENILASSEAPPYEAVLQGSSDVEFLAPLTLTSSLHQATPPLKTVTESLSTVETVVKRSILPVVWGAESSLYTLSQTYTITKVVTAVKTVPPMELYEFSPEHSFADFDTLFEEAGSENRESLLPGELEFSDQDNFGLEGPSLIRVEPPEEFLEDFDLIGTKFDHTEKNNEQDKVESFVPVESQPTPSLPELGLAGLGVTPEQLLYLQLLQNPLAALGIGGGLGKQVYITL